MGRSIYIALTDQSRVGAARRLAQDHAHRLGFGPTEVGNAAIIVTEIATNIVKHANTGVMLLRPLEDGSANGLEILAVDKGPGMADVSRCMSDGYSTAGSPGHGLGAVARLSKCLEIYSQPSKGTVLVAQLWAQSSFRPGARVETGAACVAMHEQERSGDTWAIRNQPHRTTVIVADGLGHGEQAAAAADEAVRVFNANPNLPPADLLRTAHGPLRATRGASVAVAEINFAEGLLHYAGVGNISAVILDGAERRSMVSHSGTLGHEMRRVQQFSNQWHKTSLLIMCSDGLGTRWDLDAYPGLRIRHPSVVAGVLYRDFQRGRDDVTVVAIRERG
jgi:anti-sigma regulatory factor (Ser/Thr protein kinase)